MLIDMLLFRVIFALTSLANYQISCNDMTEFIQFKQEMLSKIRKLENENEKLKNENNRFEKDIEIIHRDMQKFKVLSEEFQHMKQSIKVSNLDTNKHTTKQ